MPLWLLATGAVALWWRPILAILAVWIVVALTLRMCSGTAWESDMRAAIERDGSIEIAEVYKDEQQRGVWARVEVRNPTPYRITDISLTCDALNDDGVAIIARTIGYGSPTVAPHAHRAIRLRFDVVSAWVPVDTVDVSSCQIEYEPTDASEGRNDQWVQSPPI